MFRINYYIDKQTLRLELGGLVFDTKKIMISHKFVRKSYNREKRERESVF